MKDGYKKIFWGVFIATFSINLGMVKILPAFIGWMVVASGISILEVKSDSVDYGTAKTISYVLVAITLVGGLLNVFGKINLSSHYMLLFYPLMVMLIELILLHRIFEGSVQSLESMENYSASGVYVGKDRTYIILSGISIILVSITLFLNLDTLGFFAGIFALVTRIYLLAAISSLGKEDWGGTDEMEENDYDPEHTSV
ncbi:hypothetical protein [Gudongella sp. SC589]|uniref:hypothetical protein n=1 Tax=Gudongella sp. SC589 TaxID=3385990 RepID=UPI003904BF82